MNFLLWLNTFFEMQTLTCLCCFTSGSYSSSDVGGMYSSSSYGSDIPPRRDVSSYKIVLFPFLLESPS